MDLIYFGYDGNKLQDEFIESVKIEFPNVKLKDAYDSTKGYRQELYIEDNHKEDLNMWLIANGWCECSFVLRIMSMDKDEKGNFKKLVEKTKCKYPEAFKN